MDSILAGTEKDKADNYLMRLENYLWMGALKPVRGVLLIAIRVREKKFEGIILPKANAREAAVVSNLVVYGLNSNGEVIRFFDNESFGGKRTRKYKKNIGAGSRVMHPYPFYDISDTRLQNLVEEFVIV